MLEKVCIVAIVLRALIPFFQLKTQFFIRLIKVISITTNKSQLLLLFFYLGIFSCLLLILHATFLGIDLDSKLFKLMRRIIIILFILFEVTAQILLTKNLFALRVHIKHCISKRCFWSLCVRGNIRF